jgi:glycosyltransferase involved in cell wall biosynthesis
VRIAFVVNQLALGGAERQAADIAKALGARGHECTVFTFYGKTLLAAELARARVAVWPLDAGRTYWRGVVPLAKALRRWRAEIVNTHMPLAGVFGRIAALLAGVPVVSTEQIGATWLPIHIRVANDLTLNTSARIVCISREVRRTLYRRTNPYLLRRSNADVIYNSVDLNRLKSEIGTSLDGDLRAAESAKRLELGLSPDDIVVTNVGRYHEQKGQAYLIDALAQVVERRSPVKLVLVGWGADEGALRARADARGVGDQVTFAIERADAPAIVAASDVFAFPSLYEGLGVALLEAMALRRPIVATDIAPLVEVVRDEVDALLVPPRDVQALASAVLRLVDDPAFAAALAASAQQRVRESFTVEHAASEYERVFEEVARGSVPRP